MSRKIYILVVTTVFMENKILEILKDGEKTTTEISAIIRRNYYDVVRLLEDLESKKKLEKIEMGKFTFWRLIKNGK